LGLFLKRGERGGAQKKKQRIIGFLSTQTEKKNKIHKDFFILFSSLAQSAVATEKQKIGGLWKNIHTHTHTYQSAFFSKKIKLNGQYIK